MKPRPPGILPTVRDAQFTSQGSGIRYRHLTLEFQPVAEGGGPLKVEYSLPSEHFDAFMNRLAVSLSLFGAVAGIVSAAIALVVSRKALQPLRETAEAIGEIDERMLDR